MSKADSENEKVNLYLIADSAVREREIIISEAKKTWQEKLILARGNSDLEFQAWKEFQAKKMQAETDYQEKTASAGILASKTLFDALTKGFQSMTIELPKVDNSAAIKDIDKQEEDLKKQREKGEISTREYYKKIADLDNEKNKLLKQNALDYANIFKSVNDSIVTSLKSATAELSKQMN